VLEKLIKDRDNHFIAMGQRTWPGKHKPVLALDLLPPSPPPPPRFDEYGNRITDEVDFEWDDDEDDDEEAETAMAE
jgi:hypothetical protein